VRRFDSTAVLGNQVTIGGAGFTGVLSVTLNNQRLKILSSTPTRIVATVNSVFAVGQYRLVIEAGNTSVTSTANIPSPSMVFLQCFEGYSGGGTGQTYTIYFARRPTLQLRIELSALRWCSVSRRSGKQPQSQGSLYWGGHRFRQLRSDCFVVRYHG